MVNFNLVPSKFFIKYQIFVYVFFFISIFNISGLASFILLPVIFFNLREINSIEELFPSEKFWALSVKNQFHSFIIKNAWQSSWALILTIQSNTYSKKRIIIFYDQLNNQSYKALNYLVKKKLNYFKC